LLSGFFYSSFLCLSIELVAWLSQYLNFINFYLFLHLYFIQSLHSFFLLYLFVIIDLFSNYNIHKISKRSKSKPNKNKSIDERNKSNERKQINYNKLIYEKDWKRWRNLREICEIWEKWYKNNNPSRSGDGRVNGLIGTIIESSSSSCWSDLIDFGWLFEDLCLKEEAVVEWEKEFV